MKSIVSIFLLLIFLPFSAQEITDQEAFKKCRKEFNKKHCLADDDGDDILNYLDNCKTEAGPKENNGCPWPDSDGDGTIDNDDLCPKAAGPPENNGCPWPDTDGDGILDKDDECPTKVGKIDRNGCPELPAAKRYTKDEIEEAKEKFLKEIEGFDYNKLADYIIPKLRKDGVDSKVILLKISSFHEMAGCGSDNTDYSIVNMIVNVASEKFWNDRNFKKFATHFSDRIILPYSEIDWINKKVSAFQLTYAKKFDDKTFYNAKNNFEDIKLEEVGIFSPYSIDVRFYDGLLRVVVNDNNPKLEIQQFEFKLEGNKFIDMYK